MRGGENEPTNGQSITGNAGASDVRPGRLPRDGAGSIDFPPETGPIKRKIGFGDFMEVYTVHATYRVKTPDSLDPSRSVPNMPWAKSVQAPIGSSNPIVARIVIQLVEALGTWPLRSAKVETVKRHLHACKGGSTHLRSGL